MKFDCVITNPPFQDTEKRGKTPHKLWLTFAQRALSTWLKPDGVLYQISPASFSSPSSAVLGLMKQFDTRFISFDIDQHFPEVGSSFAYYEIRNTEHDSESTDIVTKQGTETVVIDPHVFYLPNDLCKVSLSIHRKVIFESFPKLRVEWDYVTCHNILRAKTKSLSTEKSNERCFPVLHTNRQIWWSAIRQEWADDIKVMWSRSGYTKPFLDCGELGGTDMVYFVRVSSIEEGRNLAAFLNSRLMQYIFRTARWSGFGNERVFASLPSIDLSRPMSENEIRLCFGLTDEEYAYVSS